MAEMLIKNMSDITEETVRKTVENMINVGRKVKIEISEKSTPYSILDKMSSFELNNLDILKRYQGISANSYEAQASMLWTSLFWKIGEQILLVSNYNSEFTRFYKELKIGGDIEEVAPRLKEGIDRHSLSNSALFANYVTQYDSFYHRINQFKVFPSTYEKDEIERLSNSWANIASMLNTELQNILTSASVYIHELSKDALSSQFLAGGMDSITLPNITDNFTASQNAIMINTAIDEMTVEANTSYIPFNRNALNSDPTIKDISTSDICLIATSDLLNNVEFLTTLNTYFQGNFANKKFSLNTIKVMDFPTTISPNINITPGYTPLTNIPTIKGFLVEENGFIFKQKLLGTFNFDNSLTLKTSIFHHLNAMANISDRRKCVALVG